MVLAGRSRLAVAAIAVVAASVVAVLAATATTAAVVARPAAAVATVRDGGEMDCEPEMESTQTPSPTFAEPPFGGEPSSAPKPTETPPPEVDCGPGMEPTPAQESPSEEPVCGSEPTWQPEPTEPPPSEPGVGGVAQPSDEPEPSEAPELEGPPQGKENGGPFRFYLVNTETGADVGGELESPVTLQAGDLPAAWSLRADRRDGTEGGVPVEFRVDGNTVQVERYPPYMLAGNDGDVMHGWDDAPACGTGFAMVDAKDVESQETSTLRVQVAC